MTMLKQRPAMMASLFVLLIIGALAIFASAPALANGVTTTLDSATLNGYSDEVYVAPDETITAAVTATVGGDNGSHKWACTTWDIPGGPSGVLIIPTTTRKVNFKIQ